MFLAYFNKFCRIVYKKKLIYKYLFLCINKCLFNKYLIKLFTQMRPKINYLAKLFNHTSPI